MFSLVTAIISIALIAIISLAATFYGGDTMTKGQISARATAIINAGEQVASAISLYKVEKGAWPASLDVLANEKYLVSLPALASAETFSLISSAQAAPVATGDWLYDAERPHLAYVGQTSMDICAEINRQTSNRAMVLNVVDPGMKAQCVAAGSADPVVVFRNSESSFDMIALPGNPDVEEKDIFKQVGQAIDEEGSDSSGYCVHNCEPDGQGGSGPSEDEEEEEPSEPENNNPLIEISGPSSAMNWMDSQCRNAGWLADNPQNRPYCDAIATLPDAPILTYFGDFCTPVFNMMMNGLDLRIKGEYASDALARGDIPWQGMSVSVTMTQAAPGNSLAYELGGTDEYYHDYFTIGKFTGYNWNVPLQHLTGSASTLYATPLTTGDYRTAQTINGSTTNSEGYLIEQFGMTALDGDIGICGVYSGNDAYTIGRARVQVNISRGSESSSIFFYLEPGGA